MYHATGLPEWLRFGTFAAPFWNSGIPYPPYQKLDPEVQKQVLKEQIEYLRKAQEELQKRL